MNIKSKIGWSAFIMSVTSIFIYFYYSYAISMGIPLHTYPYDTMTAYADLHKYFGGACALVAAIFIHWGRKDG